MVLDWLNLLPTDPTPSAKIASWTSLRTVLGLPGREMKPVVALKPGETQYRTDVQPGTVEPTMGKIQPPTAAQLAYNLAAMPLKVAFLASQDQFIYTESGESVVLDAPSLRNFKGQLYYFNAGDQTGHKVLDMLGKPWLVNAKGFVVLGGHGDESLGGYEEWYPSMQGYEEWYPSMQGYEEWYPSMQGWDPAMTDQLSGPAAIGYEGESLMGPAAIGYEGQDLNGLDAIGYEGENLGADNPFGQPW